VTEARAGVEAVEVGGLETCVGWFQDVSCGWSGGRWKPPDLAAQRWEDPGPLICLIPADPSPSMTAAPFSRVYGVPLGIHLRELGRDIALPIEACVMMLLSEGMKEEVGLAGAGGAGTRASHPVPPLPPMPVLGCNPTISAQVPREGVASCG